MEFGAGYMCNFNLNRVIEQCLLIRWHLIKDLKVAREAMSCGYLEKIFPARESNKCKVPRQEYALECLRNNKEVLCMEWS